MEPTENKPAITIDDLKKVEIRIGEIKSAEPIEGSDKLLKLAVDFGEAAPRQVLSGIAKQFPDPSALVGRKCAFATNLEPRKMMGLESQGMILAVSGGDGGSAFFSLLETDSAVAPGSAVK
jgi:methionyl-tRNA synthetase